jgi:hypothetical protein
MANEWIDKYLRMKPEVTNLFDDLDAFQQFCQNYGYVFDESHLYSDRSPAFNEFIKYTKGREPWDQWRTPKRKEFVPRDRNAPSNWKQR